MWYNKLIASGGAAGIHVSAGRTLNIDSAESTETSPHKESGTLTVTGGWSGAGIGGGGNTVGGSDAKGSVTITGGTVTATGGVNGAGIGDGGYGGQSGGTISIKGGTVKATGNFGGAGLGGSFGGASGNITITGGDVNATGYDGGAGIGGGTGIYGGGAGGEIEINYPLGNSARPKAN